MPRDDDKHNGPRGRPAGGKGAGKGPHKGRSGAARGPEKKFAKRDGSYAPRPSGGPSGEKKSYAAKPYAGPGKPYAGKSLAGKRGDASRGERPDFKRGERDDRAPRKDSRPRDRDGEKRPFTPRDDRNDRGDARPAARFADKKFGEKKFGDKKFSDKKFSRNAPDRGPRKTYSDRPDRGADRGESKPWQKRADVADRPARPQRDAPRANDRPKFERPKFERPKLERPKFERPRERSEPRAERPKFERPQRSAWQEHPRSEGRDHQERPRRAGEDDSKIFAKRPAFGGRGEYRARPPQDNLSPRRPPRPPVPKKAGERVAKVVSRAGLCSRRDAEDWVTQGRVAVNGRVINSPALDVTSRDVVTVDGKPLPAPERTRLFMYHKPRGLMTTHADPEGRPTVFDHLPDGLPRLISIGRLDFNTEGLLLLTNDGGLARTLELPDTGWLRRYRVRAHGEVTQAQLDALKHGVEVDGVKYGSIDATLERDQGANVWLVFAIREGKNREVRNVLAHLGLEVNRLIRISYGPFQLAELEEGQVDEVKTRVLREQLGEKIAAASGADFTRQSPSKGDAADDPVVVKRPALKRSTVEDRKGRRVLVQRAGGDDKRIRNEVDAAGFGPPKRPKRGYHGKRDITPRDA